MLLVIMFSYVGDQHGLFSVIKFEAEEGRLLKSSYNLSAKFLRGILFSFLVFWSFVLNLMIDR